MLSRPESGEMVPRLVTIEMRLDPGLEVEVLDPQFQLARMPCWVRFASVDEARKLEDPLPRLDASLRFAQPDRRWYRLDEPGRTIVQLVDDLGRILDQTEVEVAEGYMRTELTVERIQAFETLSIDLRSPEGLPLEGASIGLPQDPSTWKNSRWTGEFRWTGERYVAPVASLAEVPRPMGRNLELRIAHDEFGSLRLELAPEDRELSVQFQHPAALTVHLADEELRSTGADIELRPVDSDIDVLSSVYFAGQRIGRLHNSLEEPVRFAPLTPGTYSIVATKYTMGGASALTHAEVTLGAGEELEIDLQILKGSDLEVHVPLLTPGSKLTLASVDRSNEVKRAEVPIDRRVTFEQLLPGQYQLEASIESEAILVTVPSSPIEVDLHMPNAFRVGELDEGDPMREAGFLPGDNVTAIGDFELVWLGDGSAVDPERIKELNNATSVTVLRNGQRIHLDLGESLMTLGERARMSIDGPRKGYPWIGVYIEPE